MRLYKLLLLVLSASAAIAGPITYNISINTSSVSGANGSLDFNFDPGLFVSQSASLQILDLSTDGGLVATPIVTGDVGGTLPTTLTFDNGTAFNDYFQDFTFGSTLSFTVSLYGPALSSPDGVSTSGSTFAFSMFGDAAGTMPVLTTDTIDGFAYVINVNLDGTTTATSYLPTSNSPEPGSLALIGNGIFALAVVALQRRWRARQPNSKGA